MQLVFWLLAGPVHCLPIGRSSVVIANLAHLGDLINVLPLLARLRASRSVAKLGLAIGSWGRPSSSWGSSQIAFISSIIGTSIAVGRVGWKKSAAMRRRELLPSRKCAAKSYDVAIDSYPYFGNAADLMWSIGARTRIGFTSGGAGALHTHRVAFDPKLSIVANQERLLAPILGGEALQLEAPAGIPGFRPDPDASPLGG